MPVLAVAGSARLYSTYSLLWVSSTLRLSPAIDAAPHGLNVCSCSLTALLRQTKWKPCRLVSGFCGRLLISCTEYGVPAPARGTRYRSAAQVRVRSARRVFRALFLAFDAISIFILNLDKRKKERSAFVFCVFVFWSRLCVWHNIIHVLLPCPGSRYSSPGYPWLAGTSAARSVHSAPMRDAVAVLTPYRPS